MTTANLKYRITTATFEVVQPGMIELRLTFYVSAVRLEGTGPWKLMKVLIKDLAAFFDPRQGRDFTIDGLTVIVWFKRAHTALDGTVTSKELIDALDRKEADDDANGKCFVPG